MLAASSPLPWAVEWAAFGGGRALALMGRGSQVPAVTARMRVADPAEARELQGAFGVDRRRLRVLPPGVTVTVDRGTVDRAAASGDKGAQGVQTALKSLSTQLSGAQVGITLTNLVIGFLAEPAIA